MGVGGRTRQRFRDGKNGWSAEMLKWTVSRSLSTASSTPHPGVTGSHQTMNNNKSNAASRRPFRDLSNTPPTGTSRSTINVQQAPQNSSSKPTPGRRRRCRSHGSDLRAYFHATKPNLRSAKRQSVAPEIEKSPRTETFYQSTPRVDSDIGPLTLFAGSGAARCSTAMTLPTDPSVLLKGHPKTFPANNNELPQNVMNEARANLQSHVSDFFHQISVAGSPEDVMEAESVPYTKTRLFAQNRETRMKLASEYAKTPCHPKLAKITKLHTRCRTPYHTKIVSQSRPSHDTSQDESLQQTPLAGRLAHMRIDQDASNYENMDNTVTEVLNRGQGTSSSEKKVAEILILDAEERRRVLEETRPMEKVEKIENPSRMETEKEENIYEVIGEREDEGFVDEGKAAHNDSSVSSASQLLEDPSPMSWAFRSPSDSEGVFTLRRQRGIRRKRQKRDQPGESKESTSKKRRSRSLSPTSKRKILETKVPSIEAVNRHVKKFALETDLDSTFGEITASKTISFSQSTEERKGDENTTKINSWELESPKSSMIDDFQSSKSFLHSVTETPEAPLVATVRRCLKYSPENEAPRSSNSRGSIEIECTVVMDSLHVRVIRCKDLRRTYEGPIHAYVKASLKNPCGEGSVVKRTAVHRATPNPVFHETLVIPYSPLANNNSLRRATSLDIAVWHRDRRARRSELLGCMTLPLPLAQDKEATWHPLEAGSGRNTSTPYSGLPQDCPISPPLPKDGVEQTDNNNSNSADDLTYLRYLELEPLDPLTGLPLHPTFTARGGRTPCTITRRLIRQSGVNQVPWGFSLSWGRPPRVERVDTGSPAERSGLRPGDHVVFVDTSNVVTLPREDILSLIQSATNQLILEVYRKGAASQSSVQRPSVVNVTLQSAIEHSQNGQTSAVAFTAEVFPNLAPDASPDEELLIREARYWSTLKSGQTRFLAPLADRRDILSSTDYSILFQNLEELVKLSEEIRDEGGGVESYLIRVPRITASYRRYLSGLQRACCLLVALRRNSAFSKLVCEPAVPHKRRPDITGVLLLPLEHYREMTRLVGLASPRNCQKARDLAQGYREATANAGVMEPPRDTGRPLLSLQEVESRLVFARCRPFTLAMPGRQWLFGGALAKVEGRRLQPSWALLLTDLLVFARVSRDRVLFVTEEPLRLSNIAEACFTVRKRPTEFRLQVSITPNGNNENGQLEVVHSGGCSPHGRPRRRVLVLRAPSPELKAVWHNLLQRQIIYVNTGCGGTPSLGSPEESPFTGSNFTTACESAPSPQIPTSGNSPHREHDRLRGECLDSILKNNVNQHSDSNHLAQWVRNSHQIPPPDHEIPLEEWTREELAARAPKSSSPVSAAVHNPENVVEEQIAMNSDVEQQSTASSASLSTVKSNSVTANRKNGGFFQGGGSLKDITGTSAISICRRSGCPTPPLLRDPFSPLPPKISILPPTPDLCTSHRFRPGPHDSPGRNSSNCTPADGNTEDGSEDDLDCDGEPPYRALRRFGTMSSLDQDDEIDEQGDEDNRDLESPPSGLRAWTTRASNFVVSKMVLLEQLSEGVGGYLLQPPVPPERTEFSLDPNDEEGTTSGGTSGDDIWGTPTSGGPDDESFTASPPSTNGNITGEDNYGLSLNHDDDDDQDVLEGDVDDCDLPELSMDHLLGGTGGGSLGSLRCFLGRRRLEPLPEEEDSPGSGKLQVGWW
ncbi:uncharacterized protein PsGEF [Venturia canescens]|uniref:uncharacterized protein PsGEF n=1 Tax=Venturia canescens TaxID=32260 RepID=UPI001C9BCF20|nr:uncharacterized protein LOC122411442 [Venturia canescens]